MHTDSFLIGVRKSNRTFQDVNTCLPNCLNDRQAAPASEGYEKCMDPVTNAVVCIRWKPFSMIFFPVIIVWCSVLVSGCAKLVHLQELLTLKELSEDRDQQDLYTQNQDKSFERLLSSVKDNSMGRFPERKVFVKEFGKPILIKPVVRGEESLEMWVYRYAARRFGSPKVYVYFTPEGNLKDWEYISRDEEIPHARVSPDTDSTKNLESQSSLPLSPGSSFKK